MDQDLSFPFHQSSKNHAKGHPPISKNVSDWPKEWLTTYYKAYSRLPKIPLPETQIQDDLGRVLQERSTQRNFLASPCSLEEIAALLKFSCGNMRLSEDGGKMFRAQPSAGARFPIEVYPLVLQGSEMLPSGVYHYNVKSHALDVLWQHAFSPEEIASLFTYDWIKNAAVIFILTGVFWRTQIKYGERGYRYVLLEAGHIGQNVHLVSEALKLKCCALGGTKDEAIEKLLDIDGNQESVLYALAVGK